MPAYRQQLSPVAVAKHAHAPSICLEKGMVRYELRLGFGMLLFAKLRDKS